LRVLLSCLLLLCSAALAQPQEFLQDLGFELNTPDGTRIGGAWTATWQGIEAGAICTGPAARNGNCGLLAYSDTYGGVSWCGTFQKFAAPPGCIFTGRAWCRSQPEPEWVYLSRARVEIRFYDNGYNFATYTSPALTDADSGWQLLEAVTPPTPSNITHVVFMLYIEKRSLDSGASAACFDDCSLTVSRESGPPWLSLQPASWIAASGSPVSFQAVATGEAPFTYQWQFNRQPIINATNATFTLPAAMATSAGEYRVSVSNAQGAVLSDIATLQVLSLDGPVLVPQQIPAYGYLNDFTGVALNVVPGDVKVAPVIGVPALWTKPTFANPSVTLTPNAFWSADVTTGSGDQNATVLYAFLVPASASVPLLSGAASIPLSFYDMALAAVKVVRNPSATYAPPAINVPPRNLALPPGATASFSVVATNSGTVNFQWYRGSAAIPGATTSTLTLTNVQTTTAGRYSVAVTSAPGSESRTSATLEILPILNAARSGTNLVLTWPVTATAYSLERANSVSGPWAPATITTVISGSVVMGTTTTAAPAEFYRLRACTKSAVGTVSVSPSVVDWRPCVLKPATPRI
jgi:hypothetical protein